MCLFKYRPICACNVRVSMMISVWHSVRVYLYLYCVIILLYCCYDVPNHLVTAIVDDSAKARKKKKNNKKHKRGPRVRICSGVRVPHLAGPFRARDWRTRYPPGYMIVYIIYTTVDCVTLRGVGPHTHNHIIYNYIYAGISPDSARGSGKCCTNIVVLYGTYIYTPESTGRGNR